MANTLLKEMVDYVGTNTSLTLGTDLFCGFQPDSPDRCVSLHEAPIMLEWCRMHLWTLQILTRAFDMWHAHTDNWLVFNLLENKDFSLVTYKVFCTSVEMPPLFIGRDGAGRHMFSARLRLPYKEG